MNLGSLQIPGVKRLDVVQQTNNNSPLFLIGIATVNGSINMSLSYCAPLITDKEAQQFLDSVQEALIAE
jgi:hypothetical protein